MTHVLVRSQEFREATKRAGVVGMPVDFGGIIFRVQFNYSQIYKGIDAMDRITSPTPDEYAEFYTGYIQRAQARGDALAALPKQIDEIESALGNLTDEQALFRDAPKEWSIKEVMGHLNDVERVFSYRLLRVSRNDSTPLPGFEQEDFVREAGFDAHPIKDLIREFEHLRRANILAIQNMSAESSLRVGTASGKPASARALIYMLVGHVDHHMESLNEKYLPNIK